MRLDDLEHRYSQAPTIPVEAAELSELRAERLELREVEQQVSFVRRVVHGRLDMITVTRRSRAGELTEDHLMRTLPEVLVGPSQPSSRPGRGAPVPDPDPVLLAEADSIGGGVDIGSLLEAPDAVLEAASKDLAGYERRLSHLRANLHRRLNSLSAEIGRRHASGQVGSI